MIVSGVARRIYDLFARAKLMASVLNIKFKKLICSSFAVIISVRNSVKIIQKIKSYERR